MAFVYVEELAPRPTPQAGGPLLVGYPLLVIKYIGSPRRRRAVRTGAQLWMNLAGKRNHIFGEGTRPSGSKVGTETGKETVWLRHLYLCGGKQF